MLNNNHQSIAITQRERFANGFATPLAIACASGGFKAIFVHGVLSAFESANFHPDAYSAASGSVVVAALANVSQASQSGINYWLKGLEMYTHTKSMSQVSLAGIDYFNTHGGEKLFQSQNQFYIAANAITNDEIAEQTQSKQARRLGKKLLIAAAKNEPSWVKRHLRLDLFSTTAKNNLALSRDNFSEVAYASGRMLHNYDVPAWINNQPYIDASYTCVCPAIEMVEQGYQTVIAIATEAGNFYRDLFQSAVIPTQYQQVPIRIIQPDINPKDMSVDVFQATPEGLAAVYQHGLDKGREFLT
jgi:predicted patatin/cPLA2 family phospholipase